MVTVQLGEITVASVYVPNGGRDFPAKMRFLKALEDWVAEFQARASPLVVCGDLNVARAEMDVHPKERKPNAIGQLPEERALLERIISQGLVDLCRDLDPSNDGLFTWCSVKNGMQIRAAWMNHPSWRRGWKPARWLPRVEALLRD